MGWAGLLLLLTGVRHVVSVQVHAAAVMMGRHLDRLDFVAALLRLEKFLERNDTGQDQSDLADQQRLGGQQGDETERHRSHDRHGGHTGHHYGHLNRLLFLFLTPTCRKQMRNIGYSLVVQTGRGS